MTGAELNELYGAVISPDARIAVPQTWMPAVHEAIRAFEVLPTRVRAFMIVTGIAEAAGAIEFRIAAAPTYIDEDGWEMIAGILANANAAIQRSVH